MLITLSPQRGAEPHETPYTNTHTHVYIYILYLYILYENGNYKGTLIKYMKHLHYIKQRWRGYPLYS